MRSASITLIALFFVVFLQAKHPQRLTTEGVKFDFNQGYPSFTANYLKLFSLGYTYAASNLLWIRFLLNTHPYSMGHNEVSWMFVDLNSIMELDPDFTPVYTHAAVFLATITEDYKGAEQILLKGIKKIPNNWRLYAYLGYLYKFEMKDDKRATEYYSKAARFPDSPFILGVLSASLLTKQGQKLSAVRLLEDLKWTSTNEDVRKKFTNKILALQ